ncbi:MAG: zinc ribbon domain-containing protein, partial [Eubacteriales bacterium]
MNCPNCNHEMPEQENFCTKCGASLQGSTKKSKKSKKTKKSKPSKKQRENTASDPENSPQTPKKKSLLGKCYLFLCVVMIILGGGLGFCFGRGILSLPTIETTPSFAWNPPETGVVQSEIEEEVDEDKVSDPDPEETP